MADRIGKLRSRFEELKIDAILVTDDENRRYLSGFVGTAGYLFITQNGAVLATDSRYTEQAGDQAPDYRVDRITGRLEWLPALAAEFGVKRLGFEADNVTVHLLERFKAANSESENGAKGFELVPTTGVPLGLRAFKDADELALLQRSIDIADHAFSAVAETIRVGDTEEEIAWRIEVAVREQGAESLSFPTIVGSGPNAALPHHRAGEREVREGEPIVIDMGARYRGYCSDLTRTVVVGEPDEQFKKVYDTVLAAQLTAIESVESGMTGAEADNLARTVINEAGYGELFGHSLGHGIGLEVHEAPWVASRVEDKLEDGMTFTIEPGIYISGWGGVRIEDIVVLENGRARVLSHAPKSET
ncbi:MAG: aminopeptidase P family protein [Chloroflexi bacterium]|nr:aminopeptidase P family protein [Chloroflexota bacterium]